MDYGMSKIKKLNDILKAKIFNLNLAIINNNANNNTNANNKMELDQLSNLSGQNIIIEFPIKLNEIDENKKYSSALNDKIQECLFEICEEIHGNLFAKEDIIKSIKEKIGYISKASISNFLKANTMRTIMRKYNRKIWYLNQEILQQANINEKSANEIFEKNVKKFEIANEEKKMQGDLLSVIYYLLFIIFFFLLNFFIIFIL
jgi:hypothetical protein